MQQREFISGFSELKDLLIRTYNIKKEREFVRLYFSEHDNQLLMHDYNDHKRAISLCADLKQKSIRSGLSVYSKRLVTESLKFPKSSVFLNKEFQLHGFFRF